MVGYLVVALLKIIYWVAYASKRIFKISQYLMKLGGLHFDYSVKVFVA